LGKIPQIPIGHEKASAFVGTVEHAVGDGIKENKIGHMTGNGTKNTIWDLIYTGFINTLTPTGCATGITGRGKLWELVSVFDPDTGFIFHAQRENRHKDLQRSWSKGKEKLNYAYCSTYMFNRGLPAQVHQLLLADCTPCNFNSEPSASEIEKIGKTTNQILSDLNISDKSVNGHVFILFESVGHMLKSIRAVMYNEKMALVAEKSLNDYISASESIIMDNASDYSDAANNPSHGLEFTKEAIKRKGRHLEAVPSAIDNDAIS